MDLAKASAVAAGLVVGAGLWLALPPPAPVVPPEGNPAGSVAPPVRRATLLFYALPGCPGCEAALALLDGMAPENPGIRFERRDALAETSETAVEREFAPGGDDHGALLLDGSGRIVWKAGGHALTRERVDEGIALSRGERRPR